MTPSPARSVAFLVALAGIAAFSMMDAVMKSLVLAIGTYATLFWRTLAGVALCGLLYLPGRDRWPERRTLRLHLARGSLTTGMAALFFWGLGRVPLAQGVALAFIAPLIALCLAAALLRERVGRPAVAGAVLGSAGILVILIGQQRAELGDEALAGSLAIIASAICYAVNIVLMRAQALAAGPLEIAFFQNVTMSALLVAALPLLGAEPPPPTFWPFIALAALLSTTALVMLSWAYARAEASHLATTEYSAFLWAALFGWWFFAEAVSSFTFAGAALIVLGCLVAARSPAAARASLEANI